MYLVNSISKSPFIASDQFITTFLLSTVSSGFEYFGYLTSIKRLLGQSFANYQLHNPSFFSQSKFSPSGVDC